MRLSSKGSVSVGFDCICQKIGNESEGGEECSKTELKPCNPN